MRKTFITLLFVMSVFSISIAQTITNGGFENWTSDSIDGWDCSNADLSFFSMTNVSIVDENTPEGTKAVLAESKSTAFFTMSGIVCNGIYEAPNPSNNNIETIKGVAFIGQPSNLYLWYKCEPMANDSALIKVSFLKDGTEIASGLKVEKNSVPDWTLLDIPISWTQQTLPDTMIILLKSSYGSTNSIGGAVAGSKLYADGLSFSRPVSVQNKTNHDMVSIFPVPFNDNLHVQLKSTVGSTYKFISTEGKTVLSGKENAGRYIISTSSLAKGCYILQIDYMGIRHERKIVK